MTSDRDRLHLEAIVHHGERAMEWVGAGRRSLEDERTLWAVLRALEVIGEAAKQLSPALKAAHPGLPWRGAMGLRDKLIHGYLEVRVERVRAIVENDLPALVGEVRRMLRGRNRAGASP